MTTAQVVRRRFKSGLPRKPENRQLTKFEAMAKTMELYDRLRGEMESSGLKKSDVSAALAYYQPKTNIIAAAIALPEPKAIGTFVEKVMALENPVFLGLVFIQRDHEAKKNDQKHVAFVCPFISGPEEDARLLLARTQQAKAGLMRTVGN